jgi:hypothetical protein
VCTYRDNDENMNSNSEPVKGTLGTDTNTTEQLLISVFKKALLYMEIKPYDKLPVRIKSLSTNR